MGLGKLLLLQIPHLLPVGPCKDIKHKLMYQRSMSYITQRVNKCRKLIKLYAKHQEELKYKKNMMLVEARRGQKTHFRHNYSKSNL